MNQLALGLEARDEALDRVELSTAERKEWVRRGRLIAQNHIVLHKSITSDELRQIHPVPEGVDPRILGAVFRSPGPFIRLGWKQTENKDAHGRPIAIWGLK